MKNDLYLSMLSERITQYMLEHIYTSHFKIILSYKDENNISASQIITNGGKDYLYCETLIKFDASKIFNPEHESIEYHASKMTKPIESEYLAVLNAIIFNSLNSNFVVCGSDKTQSIYYKSERITGDILTLNASDTELIFMSTLLDDSTLIDKTIQNT